MLTKIALRNIREKKFQSFLIILSITISTFSLLTFFSISTGIQEATFEEFEKITPQNQITVLPNLENTSFLSLLSQDNSNTITTEKIEEIKKIKNVKNIYPELQFNNFASIEATLLGYSLITDTMIFGLDEGFVKNSIQTDNWNKTTEPYPVIIPKKVLDIYNYSIATPQNIPIATEQGIIGKEITLYPNFSTFFPGVSDKAKKIKLEVVGFSEKTNLIGVSLSTDIVKKLNKDFAVNSKTKYTQLYVETSDSSKTEQVAKQIEALGFSTTYFQKNMQEVQAKFNYLTLALSLINFIIVLSSAIAIISIFLASIAEKIKQIGLYRALGATKIQIKKIILIRASILGIIGSLFGISISLISSRLINNYLKGQFESLEIVPDNISLITNELLLLTFIFGTCLAIFSAYIPAQKASKLKPIEALTK